MKLVLEMNGQFPEDSPELKKLAERGIMLTPAIKPDRWLFRVKLSEKNAIVGFPKFTTIGIGFQHEEDWNTNLPFSCPSDEIWKHIRHNKADAKIRKPNGLKAIQMIREAAAVYLKRDLAAEEARMRASA